ncbi:GNAT family N-acetyltransferase [Sutcliffiella cohnii]
MSVRPYKLGDKEKIQELFEVVFKHKRTELLWSWKFEQTPNNLNPWILVYEEDGEILGHISLWVHDAFVFGEKVPIGLRIDTMVHPNARGKGIYKQLNQHLVEKAKEDNIYFLYGFPAVKARELFLKYTNAVRMIDMPRYWYIQRPLSILASKITFMKFAKPIDSLIVKLKNKQRVLPEDCSIKEVTLCGEEFNDLAERTKNSMNVHIVRNKDYLNWRYLNHPENKYTIIAYHNEDRLDGYIVIKKELNKGIKSGYIMDLLSVEDNNIKESLLNYAMQKLNDVDIIQAWTLPNTTLSKTLKKAKFFHKDSPMALVGKEISTESLILADVSNWNITLGDVDSF